MVKSSTQKQQEQQGSLERVNNSDSCKYKGVRKRKWGKWVSEIRLPNSRERIWLGSYDSAVKAARAFDAALYCLRGRGAKFNFPDNPPEIANGRSMTPTEIQVAASRFAHSDSGNPPCQSGRVDNLDAQSSSFSSCELHAESPCPSVSDGAAQPRLDSEITDIPLDNAFLDQFLSVGMGSNSVTDYGIFPGFDDLAGDLFGPPISNLDYEQENCDDLCSSQELLLWDF